MTMLFAIVGGSAVGNLYWAQPLLATITTSLGVDVPIDRRFPLAEAGAAHRYAEDNKVLGRIVLIP